MKKSKIWRERQIEIISLVDIAFLLLIFFLVIAAAGRIISSGVAQQTTKKLVGNLPRLDQISGSIKNEKIYAPILEAIRPQEFGTIPFSSVPIRGWILIFVDPLKYSGKTLSMVHQQILSYKYPGNKGPIDQINSHPALAFLPENMNSVWYPRAMNQLRSFIYRSRSYYSQGTGGSQGEIILRWDKDVPIWLLRAVYNFAGEREKTELGGQLSPLRMISFRAIRKTD